MLEDKCDGRREWLKFFDFFWGVRICLIDIVVDTLGFGRIFDRGGVGIFNYLFI